MAIAPREPARGSRYGDGHVHVGLFSYQVASGARSDRGSGLCAAFGYRATDQETDRATYNKAITKVTEN